MKKVISIFLVIILLLSMLPMTVSAASGTPSRYYSDVYSSDSYYAATTYLYEHTIMVSVSGGNGVTKGQFAPAASLSRAQIVTILWRMVGSPNIGSTTQTFTDCNASSYYYKAVLWAAENGITAGTSTTTFSPNRAVTQQETLTFLYRFMCFCGYEVDSSYYGTIFNSSPLQNKASFGNYAKRAIGWAYSRGIFTNTSLSGTSTCARGTTAEYIYTIYKKYQRKYGLTVVNTTNMTYAEDAGTAMQALFKRYNASNTQSKKDITKAQFDTAMSSAFSSAKPLDICYLYCACHGGTSGLALFSDSTSHTLTPSYLRSQIDRFSGTFVVFVSGCRSGTYVTKGATGESEDDVFDPDAFLSILTEEVEGGELGDDRRIKVLCSSQKDEDSYKTINNATKYWCLGCGFDLEANSFGSLVADTNIDSRISLNELYAYSREKVLANHPNQHIVCSPSNDNYIIFERVW